MMKNTPIACKKSAARLLDRDKYMLGVDNFQPKREQGAVVRIVFNQWGSDPSARITVTVHSNQLIPSNCLNLLKHTENPFDGWPQAHILITPDLNKR